MKKQKYISKKWFILLAVVLLLIPIAVHAAPATPTVTGQAVSTFNDVLQAMVTFLSKILELLQKILWPMFLAIGGLMNNDLLFGAGMEERLLSIWVQIRNLVNIGFVVILLGIALYNVTGFSKEGDYQMKTFLPKFVIALILVNFTFIGLKFILDVSNVLTHVVFTLPSSISAELQGTSIYLPKDDELDQYIKDKNLSDDDLKKIKTNIDRVCKSMFGSYSEFQKKVSDYNQTTKKDALQDPKNYYCEVDTANNIYVLTENGRNFFKQYTSRNSAMILAVQMMKVVDIDKLSDALKGSSPNISALSFNLLFSVIMYLVYGVAYVVLFVVLLARLVFLWIIIALSPLIAVKIVFSKLPMGDKDYFNMFIVNAFIPAIIGIPLTIGYIMLGALQEASNPITNDFDWTKAFNLETSGVSDLQTMVIAFGAVAVVWIGVFAAAEKSIASSVVQSIKGRVTGAGRALARAARFLPIIPAAGGAKGRASVAQLTSLINAPLRKLQEQYGGEFGGKTVSKYNIEALGRRGRAGTPRELKQYLAQGITTPKYRAPLGKVIKGWERGTAEQQTTRREVLRFLGGPGTAAAREFERTGKLTEGQARQIQKWAQGQVASPLGTPTRRTASASATPQAKAEEARKEKARQVIDARDVGYISANDEAFRKQASPDTAAFGAYIKDKNNQGKLKAFAGISASKDQLTAAQTHAKQIQGMASVTEAAVKDTAAKLSTQLQASKTKLQAKGVDPKTIKDILTKVVETQLGDKKDAFYGTASGKKVQALING
jgi:hypothetical protein